MNRGFHFGSFIRSIGGGSRGRFSFPAVIIFVWAITLCSPSVAEAKAPSVSVSPTSLSFGSQSLGTTSSAHRITLTNTVNVAVTISTLAISGASSGDFAQTNNCGSNVSACANCTIAVTFKPSASGSPQTVSLSGTGSHDVILSWTGSTSPGVTGYTIYRGTTSGGESTSPLNSTSINGTNFTDEIVTAGAAYYYLATSVISSGVTPSPASAEASTTVQSP